MRKIMVVDDDREFLDEMSELLRGSGYETYPFVDGRKALEEAGRIRPEIILLDLKLSGASGFEVAVEFRRLPQTEDASIIAVTGFYTEKEHIAVMKICGIEKCLIKPINPLDVIWTLENIKEKG